MGNNFFIALLFSSLAGLSTGIGGLLSVFKITKNNSFLAFVLGFSSGFMIYVSLVEILKESTLFFNSSYNENLSLILSGLSFFLGITIVVFVEVLIPNNNNIVSTKSLDSISFSNNNNRNFAHNKTKLFRSGILTAVVVAIHNMPEGIITFMSALTNTRLALTIIIAIAIHNIPEGIAVAVQIYHASGNRKKAVLVSFLSGLTEPLGAIVGYLILKPFLNNIVFGILFGVVSGIMVFISVNELLPTAFELKKQKITVFGFVLGMLIMSLSLVLLSYT